MSTKRHYYLDVLRVLAALAVVLLHVSGHISLELGDDTGSVYWHICNIFDSGTRWSVPIFVMISGCLFLNPQKEISTKDIYKKNILRMVVAYIIWSALYTLFFSFYSGSKMPLVDFVKNLVVGTITGGMYHLWFVPMIIGLYIIAPVFRKFIANASEKNLSYFVLITFIYTIVLKMLTSIPFANDIFGELINTFGTGMSVSGYILYFVLGYYLSIVSLTKIQKRIIYLLGVISFVVTVSVTGAVSYFKGYEVLNLRDYFSLNVFLMSISLFVFVKEKFEVKEFSTTSKKVVSFLSKYSFGVYLSHPLILVCLVDFYVCTGVSVLALIIVYFVLSCIIPLLISWVIGKIPILRKYMI